MQDERSRVEKVFLEAVGLDQTRRNSFLDTACGPDRDLRAGVESLLREDAQSRGFLDTPVVCLEAGVASHLGERLNAAVTGAVPPIAVGSILGRYRLIKLIGEGAMGCVYEAEESGTARRVAVKVLREALGTRSTAQRFRDEARILGRLNHTGVARVFESGLVPVGRGEGLPYFAMELIRGARPLTAYCAENGLGLRARLALFAGVCEAVQSAHQHLVVHRDLKPANILVDDTGVAKVIDFGVARWPESERTVQTGSGQLIGTLQYMAPEQCGADPSLVNVCADVFGLGAILFELLCGRPWLALAGVPTARAVVLVAATSVPRPSSIERAVPRDIDTIVAHAMAREPTHRYLSAGALGEDIRRYLRNEPIAARRASAARQLALLVKRNKAQAIMASVLIAALLALGATIAAWRVDRKAAILAQVRTRDSVLLSQPDLGPSLASAPIAGASSRLGGNGNYYQPLSATEQKLYGAVGVRSSPDLETRATPIQLVRRDGTTAAFDGLRVLVPDWLTPTPQGSMAFRIDEVVFDDVLPAYEGRELVVALRPDADRFPLSRIGLLRIYDLTLQVRKELWTWGRFDSVVWDANAVQLVLSTVCWTGRDYQTGQAAFDRLWCIGNSVRPGVVVAISPEKASGVLVPFRTDNAQPIVVPRWTLFRRPVDLEQPDYPVVVSTTQAWAGPSGGAPYVLRANLSPRMAQLHAPPLPDVLATASLSAEGRVLTPFSIDGQATSTTREALDNQFVLVDLPALIRYREVAEPRLLRLGTADEVGAEVRPDNSIQPIVRDGVVESARAMYSNWRWLNGAAAHLLQTESSAHDISSCLRALDWSERALAIHDKRCPDPSRCHAGWYVRKTRAAALFRDQQFEEALVAFHETEAFTNVGAVAGLSSDAESGAYIAMCQARLGQLQAARLTLDSAVRGLQTSVLGLEENKPYADWLLREAAANILR